MANPTVVAAGTASELIQVTDQDGVVFDVPKVMATFVDTSIDAIYRVDFNYGMKSTSLIFTTSAAKDTFIAAMKVLY